VQPSRPCRLSVTGSAANSRRWCGLYDYTDTLEHEDLSGRPELAGATLVNGFTRVVHWLNLDEGAGSVAGLAAMHGTTDLLPTFVENSQRLQALCHKLNLEAARLSREVDGYALWLLQDYWQGGQGLLNQFCGPKGLSAEEARRLNGPTVVLLRRERCAFQSGETVSGTAVVSNFAEAPLQAPRLRATLLLPAPVGQVAGPAGAALAGPATRGTKPSVGQASRLPTVSPRVLAEHSWELGTVPQGAVADLAEVRFTAPDLPEPARLQLRLTLADGDRSWDNEWDVWVFPRPQPIGEAAEVGLVGGAAFADLYPEARQVSPTSPLPSDLRLLVAGAVTPDLLQRLAAGQRVLLLAPQAFPGDGLRFKSPWWFPTSSDTDLGTIIRDHPALAGFPHDGWCDLPWFEMIEGSVAVHHSGPLAKVQPIIQAIDLPLRQLTRSLLFEAQVGEGRLLCSSLNLSSDVVRQSPAARQVLDGLLRYALSDDFAPRARLTPEELVSCLADRDALEAPPVEGFARVLAAAPDPHSGQTAAEPATERSYRGGNVRAWIVRQEEQGRFVTWETAPVPERLVGDRVTIVFAGTLGWISEPAGRFTLLLGDDPLVEFDVTDQPAEWKSADGTARLSFEPRLRYGPDTNGIFRLTLPAARVTPGQPLRLTVRASGGSMRWFGLPEATDTVAWGQGLH